MLRGFAAMPAERRSEDVRRAVERGVTFLSAHNLAQDLFPALVDTPSHWLRFGFPLGYGSDLLEALLALVELGVDPGDLPAASLERAIQVILRKRDEGGRWRLEHALRNTWADLGTEGEPSKEVTLRALRVLNWFGGCQHLSATTRESGIRR